MVSLFDWHVLYFGLPILTTVPVVVTCRMYHWVQASRAAITLSLSLSKLVCHTRPQGQVYYTDKGRGVSIKLHQDCISCDPCCDSFEDTVLYNSYHMISFSAAVLDSGPIQAVREVKVLDIGVNSFTLSWKKTPGASGYKISWIPFLGKGPYCIYTKTVNHVCLHPNIPTYTYAFTYTCGYVCTYVCIH